MSSYFSQGSSKEKEWQLWKTPVFWQLVFFNYTLFFIINTFISSAKLKLAENQANGKQYPEIELLLFENYSLSSSTLSSRNHVYSIL